MKAVSIIYNGLIRGLLLKLEIYGIKGSLLIWLESYITNRTQMVVLKEMTSELCDLKAGVQNN